MGIVAVAETLLNADKVKVCPIGQTLTFLFFNWYQRLRSFRYLCHEILGAGAEVVADAALVEDVVHLRQAGDKPSGNLSISPISVLTI